MPYNNDLLRQIVDEYDFEVDYSIKCLEANRHNHITATYHLINKRNKRAIALKESIGPNNSFNVTQTNYHTSKSPVDTAQMPNRGARHSRKKFIDPLNQTMPIGTALANNLKVNNMMMGGTGPANSTITGPDGGSAAHHHREMSLDDERGNRR